MLIRLTPTTRAPVRTWLLEQSCTGTSADRDDLLQVLAAFTSADTLELSPDDYAALIADLQFYASASRRTAADLRDRRTGRPRTWFADALEYDRAAAEIEAAIAALASTDRQVA